MLRVALHDTHTRRTCLPTVHLVYEGEELPPLLHAALLVDVGHQGEVTGVSPLTQTRGNGTIGDNSNGGSEGVEVHSFYVAREEDEDTTLHIQGSFPSAYQDELESFHPAPSANQTALDLLTEFTARNGFLRSLLDIPSPPQETLTSRPTQITTSAKPDEKQNSLQQQWTLMRPDAPAHSIPPLTVAIPANAPPAPVVQQPSQPSTLSPPHPQPQPYPVPLFQPLVIPTAAPMVKLDTPRSARSRDDSPNQFSVVGDDGTIISVGESEPDSTVSSPVLGRKGANLIISPYKGQSRHPSPSPTKMKSNLIRPLFLDPNNPDDFGAAPQQLVISPLGALTPSSRVSPSPSPPHLLQQPQNGDQIRRQVDDILNSALQLKYKMDELVSNEQETIVQPRPVAAVMPFDSVLPSSGLPPISGNQWARRSAIRRSGGLLMEPPSA